MNLFAISGLILGITSTLLALIVGMNRRTDLQRIWVIFNIVIALWGFGAFLIGQSTSHASALLAWKIAHVGVIFIPICFFHTICIFCEIEKRRKNVIIFAYLQGFFFLIMNLLNLLINEVRYDFNSLYYNEPSGWMYYIFLFLWISFVSWGHYELIMYFRHSSGVKRNQSIYFFIGMAIGFLGGSTNFLPMFGIKIYPFGNFTIPIYCLISTYAILRYRLMDIKLVFRKSMVYSLCAGILTSLFVVLILAMTRFLSDMAGITSFAITVIAALLIAVLFNPLRIRIQNIVDRIFYKKSYDYYSTIRQISSTLTSMFDINNICKYIGNIVYETLGVNGVRLLAVTRDNFRTVYQISRKQPKTKEGDGEDILRLEGNSEIVKLCREFKDIIIKDELPTINFMIEPETIEKIEGELEPFHAEAVVPVIVDGQLSLLIITEEKLSADMFSSEDINLLGTIAEQTAIAIKNSRLYSDKVNTDRLASIGMMSATFAHEIRNPLTSLKTFAQLMPEKYNDAEFRGTFSKIVEGEIEKIDGLISDLLDFSTEKQTSRINDFNIVDVVDESVNYVKSKFDIQRKNIAVEKHYNENKIDMSGDVIKLQQAFVNIMTNGCQAMNGEGLLRVGIKRNEDHVEVEIADNGEGISQNDLSRIFDPFITSKEMGVGLGLAISKRIIEDHGGSINVQSELSVGTMFTIILPVKNW